MFLRKTENCFSCAIRWTGMATSELYLWDTCSVMVQKDNGKKSFTSNQWIHFKYAMLHCFQLDFSLIFDSHKNASPHSVFNIYVSLVLGSIKSYQNQRTPQWSLENPAIPYINFVGHERDSKNAIRKYPYYLLNPRQEFYVFIHFILAFFWL